MEALKLVRTNFNGEGKNGELLGNKDLENVFRALPQSLRLWDGNESMMREKESWGPCSL